MIIGRLIIERDTTNRWIVQCCGVRLWLFFKNGGWRRRPYMQFYLYNRLFGIGPLRGMVFGGDDE